MKKINMIVLLSIICSTVVSVRAEDIKVDFDGNKSAATLENITVPAVPAPAAEVNTGTQSGCVLGEITKMNLYAQTAKSLLFTYADTEPLFKEFVALWTPILEKFDLKPSGTTYQYTFGTLNYESANGMVVRDFLADKLHYNALDPAEMTKLQNELIETLEKDGITPIASFNIRNEVFRPTFNIYYLTKPDENPAHEIRLRYLSDTNNIDFDIVANAVQIVKKDTPSSMAYIGKELGFTTRWSATEEGVNARLEEAKKSLEGKEFIGSRIIKLDTPYVSEDITVNYVANIYFFK